MAGIYKVAKNKLVYDKINEDRFIVYINSQRIGELRAFWDNKSLKRQWRFISEVDWLEDQYFYKKSGADYYFKNEI